MKSSLANFAVQYVRSMRLYYGFVTLTAGWIGVALCPVPVAAPREAAILVIMFCGWGVNQLVNDFTNRREDAVNAPRRPMVTGALAPLPAIAVSAAVITAALAYSAWLVPLSMIPIATGVVLNVAYSYLKGFGLAGNLAFAFSILCCAWYGFVAGGGPLFELFTGHPAVVAAVLVINMVMTTFTYFKDVAGDRAAGKRTVVVALGPARAAAMMRVAAFLPLVVLVALAAGAAHPALYLLTVLFAGLLFIVSGFRFGHHFSGPAAYHQLGLVFAATAAAQAALVALAAPLTGAVLAIVSAAAVLVIFGKGYGHADE